MVKVLGIWWNDKTIEVVEIEGKAVALDGWNGEAYVDCFEVTDQHGEAFFEIVKEGFEVKPIYEEVEGDFEIVGYEFY